MFVKLMVLIVVLGSTGVGVLSVRQSRLIASNEMTQSRLRSRELEQRGTVLRAEIARRVSPEALREMLGDDELSMVSKTEQRVEMIDPFGEGDGFGEDHVFRGGAVDGEMVDLASMSVELGMGIDGDLEGESGQGAGQQVGQQDGRGQGEVLDRGAGALGDVEVESGFVDDGEGLGYWDLGDGVRIYETE